MKSGEDTGVIIESGSRIDHQVEVQDHIHSQVQFQEKDNLPKYQHGAQVQMGVLKLNLGFQNNMSPDQINRVRDI